MADVDSRIGTVRVRTYLLTIDETYLFVSIETVVNYKPEVLLAGLI